MINKYLTQINKRYQTGEATEHSYRIDLETLLSEIINDKKIIIMNEPRRIRKVGAPDFSIKKNECFSKNR